MTSDVVTVCEDTPMMRVSLIMKEKNIRSLPVVNRKGKLGGIVTDKDLKDASPYKATRWRVPVVWEDLNKLCRLGKACTSRSRSLNGRYLNFLP